MPPIEGSNNLLHQLQHDGLKIAIIDDSKDDLDILIYQLKKLGIPEKSILSFLDDPDGFLEALGSNGEIVAAISDLKMSKKNGFQILKEIIKRAFYHGAFFIRSGTKKDEVQKMKEKFLPGINFSNKNILEKKTSTVADRHEVKTALENLLYVKK